MQDKRKGTVDIRIGNVQPTQNDPEMEPYVTDVQAVLVCIVV